MFSIAIPIVLFFLGFYILIKGANILIRGASSIANILGLSPWFIGMVIVGIGTSIPEFSINVASVFNGNNIGLATIIGSNTFNILFILGISALFVPLVFRREWIVRDLPINMLAVLVAAAAILLPFFGDTELHGISRLEGAVLTVLLFVWIFFMLRRKSTLSGDGDVQAFSWTTSLVFIIVGLVGVFFGGKWVIDGAAVMADLIGVSSSLVGFTVVAIGTSMPELAVSVVATFKRQTSIAIGNVIGSNIFDFLGILGITALIRPVSVVDKLQFDIFATFLATLLLFAAAYFIGKRFTIGRVEGVVFVLCYLIYFAFLFLRG